VDSDLGAIMNVTSQLLRVFLVDKQLRGLQSRLHAAEKFLGEQDRQLVDLNAKKASLETQHKHLRAVVGEAESEMKSLDARMEQLREQMNNAKTNKEYKAFLTEVNTYKVDRDALETKTIEQMTKVDDLKKQIEQIDAARADREKLRVVAGGDRDTREAEIRERVTELKAQRIELASKVSAEALKTLERMVHERGEDAMAPLEEQDRRRHEYTCGACMMALPVETVAALLSTGRLTHCASCGCLLYIEKELAEAIASSGSKR
jgi:predicted  nucleic acid-binding Zn-ribbon protein